MECIYEKQKTIFFKKMDLSFILIKLRKTEFNGGLVTRIVCFFFLIFLTIIIFFKNYNEYNHEKCEEKVSNCVKSVIVLQSNKQYMKVFTQN